MSAEVKDSKITRSFLVQYETEDAAPIQIRAFSSLLCKGASITVLLDNDGNSLGAYEAALQGKDTVDKFTIENGGEKFDASKACSVGFFEQFPEACPVAKYLERIGVKPDEIEAVLDQFELKNLSYLYCAQLPATAARQLWLLTALMSKAKILLLRDPFQPFSGRWREVFAEMILKDASESGRAIICTNVSFMPKIWGSSPMVRVLDVGDQALNAARKARAEEDKKREREAKQPKPAPDVNINSLLANPEKAPNPQQPPAFVLPENMNFAYKATRDFIFQPLADLSHFLRRHAFIGSLGAFAMVIVLMTTIMVPNFGALRAKIQTMHFSITMKDIWEAVRSEKKPATEQLSAETKEMVDADSPAIEQEPETAVEQIEVAEDMQIVEHFITEELVPNEPVFTSLVEIVPDQVSSKLELTSNSDELDFICKSEADL